MNIPGQPTNASSAIALFVITTKTKKHGEKFVVHEHFWHSSKNVPNANPLAVVDTIEQARAALHKVAARGLQRLERQFRDDPTVVESWAMPLVIKYLQHTGRTL